MLGTLDLAAALLLAAAGLGKLRGPQPAAAMLRRALPRPLRAAARADLVRLAGLAELAVGSAVVLLGDRAALALLALAYLAFLAVAARLVRAGGSTSCGCFGRADSPVGAAHLVLNAVAAALAVAGTVRPAGRWGGLFDGDVLAGAVGVGQAALLAALAYLAITAWPALNAERRRVSA